MPSWLTLEKILILQRLKKIEERKKYLGDDAYKWEAVYEAEEQAKAGESVDVETHSKQHRELYTSAGNFKINLITAQARQYIDDMETNIMSIKMNYFPELDKPPILPGQYWQVFFNENWNAIKTRVSNRVKPWINTIITEVEITFFELSNGLRTYWYLDTSKLRVEEFKRRIVHYPKTLIWQYFALSYADFMLHPGFIQTIPDAKDFWDLYITEGEIWWQRLVGFVIVYHLYFWISLYFPLMHYSWHHIYKLIVWAYFLTYTGVYDTPLIEDYFDWNWNNAGYINVGLPWNFNDNWIFAVISSGATAASIEEEELQQNLSAMPEEFSTTIWNNEELYYWSNIIIGWSHPHATERPLLFSDVFNVFDYLRLVKERAAEHRWHISVIRRNIAFKKERRRLWIKRFII